MENLLVLYTAMLRKIMYGQTLPQMILRRRNILPPPSSAITLNNLTTGMNYQLLMEINFNIAQTTDAAGREITFSEYASHSFPLNKVIYE